uniref:Uncharacterized protein n=1 Tax=Panagrolaimus sp. JU765 TaxID=591449 RepID=A0AC34RPX0_9BILA
MAQIQETGSPQLVKNPAPHRGFNAKAREVLLEPTTKFAALARHASDQELVLTKTKNLKRTDSEVTSGSNKSQSSSHSYPLITEEFDSLEDLPRAKAKKMLGDIGKTRSAGDLFKNQKKPPALIRTFQQMNIMKLPSVDSEIGEPQHTRSLTKLNDPLFDDPPKERQKRYEMK